MNSPDFKKTLLKSQAASGIRWTAFNRVIITILQIVQLIILGRLLDPKDFGLMAVVLVIVGFAQIIAEMGIPFAIIQRKNPTREELSTIYGTNIAAGFIMFIIICFFTPLLGKLFDSKEIGSILSVSALVLIISPFGILFLALLQKELNFRLINIITLFSTLVGVGVAVGLALKEYGVWSLVWSNLINCLVRTVLFLICGWRKNSLPIFHFHWSELKGYLSFGIYRAGALLINQFNSRIDQFLIGILIGPIELGYYNIATRIVLEPIHKINPILTQVAFPVFSIVQEDTVLLKNGFMKMIRFLMAINAPIFIGLACIAPSAIPFLFGERWTPSIPIVRALAFYALFHSMGNAAASLILAKGKASWTFFWNIALAFAIPLVVYLASLSGKMTHIAFALACLQGILIICHYRVFIRRLIGPCFTEYIHATGRPVFLSILMGITLLGSSLLISGLSVTMMLFIQVAIGIMCYILFSWSFQRDLIREFFGFLSPRVFIMPFLKKYV